jgi:transposase
MAVVEELLCERIDDVPLLLGVARQLRLAEVLDRHLGNHALNQGLSFGQLASGWIAFLLSQADHAKYKVQDWANSLPETLAHFFDSDPRRTDFSDDRLSIVLRRLAAADWPALEADLFAATCDVYELSVQVVRLDGTAQQGHHQSHPGGLMQLGHSHGRHDLPQLKVMAAADQPSGHPLACSVHPGNLTDDPLYLPLIHRVRALVGRSGLLYAGDCKMSSLATRADVAAAGDYYLCRLPRNDGNRDLIDGWIEEVLGGQIPSVELCDEEGAAVALAGETERSVQADGEGGSACWRERVQLIRPAWLWRHHREQLRKRLAKAERALASLTPPVGPGKRQFRCEAELLGGIEEVLARYEVKALLEVAFRLEEQRRRKGHTWEVLPRYRITRIRRNEEAIRRVEERSGWQVQVSNVPGDRLDLGECVWAYGQGYCLERDWAWLKNRPLGLGPLWVWREDQLLGLARLLMLALRLLTYIQLRARDGLGGQSQELRGTYAGQPGRKDKAPTAARLLESLCRAQISLVEILEGQQVRRRLIGQPPLLGRLLNWLGLPPRLYDELADPPRAAGTGPAETPAGCSRYG